MVPTSEIENRSSSNSNPTVSSSSSNEQKFLEQDKQEVRQTLVVNESWKLDRVALVKQQLERQGFKQPSNAVETRYSKLNPVYIVTYYKKLPQLSQVIQITADLLAKVGADTIWQKPRIEKFEVDQPCMKQINQYVNLKLKLEHSALLNYGDSDQDIVVIERMEVLKKVSGAAKLGGIPLYGLEKKVKKIQINIDPTSSNRRQQVQEEEKKQSSPEPERRVASRS